MEHLPKRTSLVHETATTVEKKYDEQLVTKLNQAAREGKFQIELFKDYTGKTVDELWAEFADSLRGKEKAASVSPAVK
jgi:hypothetical protein